MKKTALKLVGLTAIAIAVTLLYLTYHTYGNWAFAWQIRGKKTAAFILVALATASGTISFQTLTQNHFLTPSILGLDSLYVLIQTVLFFIVGGINMLSQNTAGLFFNSIFLMGMLSLGLSRIFLDHSDDFFLLLMVGMILGTFFSSISSFLQVLMDPNEYDLLQGKLFASFGNVDTSQLGFALVLIIIGNLLLYTLAYSLDVLHLGKDQAVNLGLSVVTLQRLVLFIISVLIGTATALVGPITFLGFIIANISYQLMGTFRHRTLFVGASLVGIILLVGGQFLVEQVFQWRTTISVVIQFLGGVYFLGKLLKERRQL